MSAEHARSFDRFFRTMEPARDKYLARLFGLFSEQIVRCWSAVPEAAYEDLGRPTLLEPGESRGSTIDFTLRSRAAGKVYVAEMKCELEYENYRYLRLADPAQLRHHTSTAFERFLRVAKDPTSMTVRLRGKPLAVDGAVLVWGAVEPEGRARVMAEHAIADVLSLEAMVDDLDRWSPPEWRAFVGRYRDWTNELFDFLS